jgi:hypothetical protein
VDDGAAFRQKTTTCLIEIDRVDFQTLQVAALAQDFCGESHVWPLVTSW